MKKLISVLGMVLIATGAMAGEEKVLSGQQNKMKVCNAQATGKKGDERKAFMKDCLSNNPAPAAAATPQAAQQNKMKVCNQEAATKSLKGPERKAFMSDCLKGNQG